MNLTGNRTTVSYTRHLNDVDTFIVATSYIIFGILGVIGNLSIIAVITMSRVYRKRFSGLFLVNLAFADFMVCVTAIPYYVTSLVMKQHIPEDRDPYLSGYNEICKLPMFFNYFTAALRILSLTAMSVDRYIAINHPYFYTRHCTYEVSKRWGFTAVFYVFFQSLVSMLPPMWQENLVKIVFFGSNGRLCGILWSEGNMAFAVVIILLNIILPAVCIVFTNCKVFWLARKQVERERIKTQRSGRSFALKKVRKRLRSENEQKQIRKEGNPKLQGNNERQKGINDDDPSKITMEKSEGYKDMPTLENQITRRQSDKNEANTGGQSRRNRETRTSSDWEIALSTLALVVFYFISYLPFMVTRLMTFSSENGLGIEVVAYTTLLTTLDSAINPLIVLKTRKEFRRILKKKICGNNTVNIDQSMWSTSRGDS